MELKSDAKERTILETWSSEKNLDYKTVVVKEGGKGSEKSWCKEAYFTLFQSVFLSLFDQGLPFFLEHLLTNHFHLGNAG